MRVSPLVLRLGVAVGVVGVLALLRFAPWSAKPGRAASGSSGQTADARETLTVGFLPVT